MRRLCDTAEYFGERDPQIQVVEAGDADQDILGCCTQATAVGAK